MSVTEVEPHGAEVTGCLLPSLTPALQLYLLPSHGAEKLVQPDVKGSKIHSKVQMRKIIVAVVNTFEPPVSNHP